MTLLLGSHDIHNGELFALKEAHMVLMLVKVLWSQIHGLKYQAIKLRAFAFGQEHPHRVS